MTALYTLTVLQLGTCNSQPKQKMITIEYGRVARIVATHFTNEGNAQSTTEMPLDLHQLMGRKGETAVAEISVGTEFLQQIATGIQSNTIIIRTQ